MNNSKISCDVIQDLLPLVQDGIASEASQRLVEEHLAQCELCSGNVLEKPVQIEDPQILNKIRKKFSQYAFLIITSGGLIGASLSYSFEFLNNILLMPLMGALCAIFLKKQWFRGVIAILGVCYICMIMIVCYQESYTSLFSVLTSPLFFLAAYAILLIIGVIIGRLLRFALKGE